MKKKKSVLILLTIFLLAIVFEGCGSRDINDNKTKTSATNAKNDVNKQCGTMNKNTCSMSSSTKTGVDNVADSNVEQTYSGWLVDYMSREIKDPENKTKECLQMDKMEKSGYGVLVKQSDGALKYYRFDENGHKLAKDILTKTKKSKGITIEAKGTVCGGILQVTALVEK